MMNILLGVCVLCVTLSALTFVQGQESTSTDATKLVQENSLLKDELQKLREQVEELRLGDGDRNGTKNIWDAAHRGSLAAVVYYYKQDPQNINKKNTKVKYWSPLMYAARYGHVRIVDYLLSKGAELDTTNTYGDTALMLASFGGKTGTMETLISHGANINNQNYKKQTALHLAVAGDKLNAVKLLVQKGADTSLKDEILDPSPEGAYSYIESRTPLESAEFKGRTAIAEYLASIKK